MIQHYREMVDDPLRLDMFRRAIEGAVRPGEIAADVGCGLGTYALFAARAGAARVYAVEAQAIVEVARELARANGYAEQVRVLSGRSTELDPVERVDLVIFEDYVTGLLTPPLVAMLRDLRERWLKPGGRLLPARARVWAAPVESRETHLALDRFADTGDALFGVDFGPTRRRAFASPRPVALRPATLIAGHALVQEIELAAVDECRVGGQGTGIARRDGLVHGLLVWFDLELPPAGWLGTGPLDPPSAWRQSYLPLDPPLRVKAGEEVSFGAEGAPLGDAMVWRWRASTAAGSAAAHSLDALLLGADALRGARPDLIPARGVELEIDAAILESVDGARDLAAIGAILVTRFPSRFGSPTEAEARAARVLGRYRDKAARDPINDQGTTPSRG